MRIRRADADDPRSNSVGIQRVQSRPGVARRENDIDAALRQQLRCHVDGIVQIKNGVSGKAAIDDANIQIRATTEQIIKAGQHKRQRQISRAEADNTGSGGDAVVFALSLRAASGNDTRDKGAVSVCLIGRRHVFDLRGSNKAETGALRV